MKVTDHTDLFREIDEAIDAQRRHDTHGFMPADLLPRCRAEIAELAQERLWRRNADRQIVDLERKLDESRAKVSRYELVLHQYAAKPRNYKPAQEALNHD